MIGLPEIPDNLDLGLKEVLKAIKNKLESPEELQLKTYTVQQLNALTAKNYAHQAVRCTNGDSGNECIAYCNGFAWYILKLGSKISKDDGTFGPIVLPEKLLDDVAPGAIEYSGSRFFLTEALYRRVITVANGTIIADTTVADTVTETTIYTEAISADELIAEKQYIWHGYGKYSTFNAADTFQVRFKLGGTTIATLTSVAASATDEALDMKFTFCVRSVGGSGAIAFHAKGSFGADGGVSMKYGTTTTDTTDADDFTVTIEWDSANASNSVTIGMANFAVVY